MHSEIPRQIVHLSGLLFVLIAQLLDKWLSASMFLSVGLFFFVYSEYARRTTALFGLRNFIRKFEKRGPLRPFTGAYWFYIGCGITFILFPHKAASLASAILAVGDSFSTIIGVQFGKHKLINRKSAEGSLAFFITSFMAALLFASPAVAFMASLIASVVELLTPPKLNKRSRWLLDDNLLIPLITGFAVSVLFL